LVISCGCAFAYRLPLSLFLGDVFFRGFKRARGETNLLALCGLSPSPRCWIPQHALPLGLDFYGCVILYPRVIIGKCVLEMNQVESNPHLGKPLCMFICGLWRKGDQFRHSTEVRIQVWLHAQLILHSLIKSLCSGRFPEPIPPRCVQPARICLSF